MWTEYINESQSLLNRNMRGFGIAILILFYGVIFSPLLFTGYMIGYKLFPQIKGSEQVLIIFLIALVLYCFLFMLKGVLLFCKGKGNLFWIPLFLICTGFTSLAPAIVLFRSIHGSQHPVIDAGLSLLLFCVVYLHYQFHADGAPRYGRPAYHLGIVIASKFI